MCETGMGHQVVQLLDDDNDDYNYFMLPDNDDMMTMTTLRCLMMIMTILRSLMMIMTVFYAA
jgi:hypothetical protein